MAPKTKQLLIAIGAILLIVSVPALFIVEQSYTYWGLIAVTAALGFGLLNLAMTAQIQKWFYHVCIKPFTLLRFVCEQMFPFRFWMDLDLKDRHRDQDEN